jgi:hypothetical protein
MQGSERIDKSGATYRGDFLAINRKFHGNTTERSLALLTGDDPDGGAAFRRAMRFRLARSGRFL